MAFIAVDDTAQFNIRADYLGIPIENVLNFKIQTGPITATNLATAAAALASEWVTNMMTNFTNGYVFREVHAVDLTDATGPIATETTGAGTSGGNSSDNEPGNVAFVVSLRTALRGRSFRGRTYMAGIRSSETTDNFLSPTRIASLVAGMESVMSVMDSAGWTLVIVSRFHNGIPRVTGVTEPVTTVLAVSNKVATQRRRLK